MKYLENKEYMCSLLKIRSILEKNGYECTLSECDNIYQEANENNRLYYIIESMTDDELFNYLENYI